MPYKAYLVEQFATTHENIFFKAFSDRLLARFSADEMPCILIGNLSVNGNQLDALFIRNGQITVIDFKNYGGTLTFSENNPWSIVNGNSTVLVAGGGYSRNPYQQVNQYRRNFITFLGERKDEIVTPLHTVNWSHISALVLFHQTIKLGKTKIPANLVYFHIADINNYIELLANITSKELVLSANEVNNILSCLNITDNNLFDATRIVIQPDAWAGQIRFDLIRRLANRYPIRPNELENILNYYYVLLELESYKEENKVTQTVSLAIAPTDLTTANVTLNYTKNAGVLAAVAKNKEEKRFQKVFL